MQTLIGIGDLLSQGWSLYVKDWKRLFEISVRYLISALILFIAALTSEQLPGLGLVLLPLAMIASIVINIHTTITLSDYTLRRDQKQEDEIAIDNQKGLSLFLPFIWISILNFFAVLGGFVLFFFPGIWLSVLFAFGLYTLVDENKRGTAALARSAELVKGRWWKTLWRILVPTIVITVLAMLVAFVLTFIMGAFVGFDRVFAISNQGMELGAYSIAEAIQTVLSSLIQIALVPLAVIYQVKVYHSLKATR